MEKSTKMTAAVCRHQHTHILHAQRRTHTHTPNSIIDDELGPRLMHIICLRSANNFTLLWLWLCNLRILALRRHSSIEIDGPLNIQRQDENKKNILKKTVIALANFITSEI